MKLYIVLWKDRHTDTTAHPFTDFKKAREWAVEQAIEYCRHPDDLQEEVISTWLYCVRYSCDDGYLWITEHELDSD